MPSIRLEPASSAEYAGPNSFIVTLSESSAQTITVQYRTLENGSAVEGEDFNEALGELIFAPGETEKTITVSNRASSADESDENYTLELHSPENATLDGDVISLQATGVIIDGNGTANNPGVFVSDPKFLETDGGGQEAVFEIRLSEPAPSTLTLNYATADGTAIAGEDYTDTSGSVTFNAGESVKFVRVPITGDTDAEETEVFSLNVTPNGFIQNGVEDSSGIATIISDDTDLSGPVINIESVTTAEYAGPNRFVVTLSEASNQTVTVDYRTVDDGSAVEGQDYNGSSGTITFLPGETQKTISISNRASSSNESDENFTVELHSPDNAALAGDAATLTATGIIIDGNGTANNLALFVSDPKIIETDAAGQFAIFELRISAPSDNAIVLSYETADGTAIAGEDYTATSGSVTLAPGQTITSVAVPITGDTDAEATEFFSLNVTPNGFIQNGVEDSSGIATIISDDTDIVAPVINIEPVTTAEYAGPNEFVVTLSEASTQTVTIDYRTVEDGSAVEGADFNGTSGTLTFLPGETQKTISVSNRASSADESDENFSVELHSPSNATLAGDAATLTATGIIIDGNGTANNLALFVSDPKVIETDAAGQFAVFELRISAPSDNPIVLSYETADGTAVAGEDYTATSGSITLAAGQTIASVAVPITGDTDVEAMEFFSLNVTPNGFIQNGVEDSSGIATIISDDTDLTGPVINVESVTTAEYAGPNLFVVTLSEASTQSITVDYRTVTDGSAVAGSDFNATTGTLTFAPGETQKTISVSNRASSADESDENFSLELFDAENATLAGDVTELKVTGVIIDGNGTANNLGLFVSDPEVVETDESGQFAVFEIRLSAPSDNPISLDYTTSDGSAQAGSDYTATSGTLVMAPGQTVAAVFVPIIADLNAEGSETFSLSVTPNGFVQNGTEDSAGTARINDDDIDLGLAVSSEELQEGPLGPRTMTFTVSLDNASDGTEVFTYETVDGTAEAGEDYTGVTGTLTFLAGETEKTVDVIILNDRATEGTEGFTLEVTENPGTAFESIEVGDGSILDFDFSASNTLNGTNGADSIAAGAGDDIVNGRNGSDDLFGGSGADKITGGRGSDDIFGGSGKDNLNGNKAADKVYGNGGNDTLKGEAGFDKLYGGGSSDRLFGGASGDSLYGGTGKDFLYGGSGQDKHWGGGGADRFVFSSQSETGTSSSTRDIIKDFKSGQGDKIDLRAMDAKTGRSGDQAFEFIGKKGFSDTKGELRVKDTGRDLVVLGDRDGDGRADFSILVENKGALDADDFFL